jgi:glycine cleavage system transcriptional repressor
MTPIHNYLIISALGPARPEMISEFSRVCTHCGCNLLNAKMNILGNEFAMTFFVAGNWGAIAKMETALPTLEQRLGLKLLARRTTETPMQGQLMPYTIQITAIDKSGILQGMSEFLYQQQIPIEEISAHTYHNHTGTRMVSLALKINVPEKIHLATLRELFMTYCDEQNLDAFLEPLRNS